MGPQIKLTLMLGSYLAVGVSPLMGAYPERPIKVIIHMRPGGGTDTMARLVFRRAQELTDASFYLENHSGAGGQIGYTTLARSKPDGYTIGAITTFSVVTHELTRTGVAYSLKGSFQPIARIVHDPVALAVRSDSPFQTLHELVEAAKSARGEHTWGITSVWGAHHIHYELFQQATGARLKTIPFDGGAAARAALLGGHIDVCSGGFSEYGSLLKAGRVRVLVIGAPARWEAFPEIPTYRDLGYDIVVGSDRGFAVPDNTGREQVAFLNDALERVVRDPQFLTETERIGLEPALAYLDAEQFTSYLHELQEQVGPRVRFQSSGTKATPSFLGSPAFFPWLIGIALVLFSVVELIEVLQKVRDFRWPRSPLDHSTALQLGGFFGLVVLFFLLFPLIGFVASAFVFLFSAMALLAGRRALAYLPVAVAIPVLLALIFRGGLGIRLPSVPLF